MLQNKIYQNFIIEIFKTFFIVLIGLSLIALTVRAVNFLDLIVNDGYPVLKYLHYSVLNIFGIVPKFIPLSFLISLMIFILKHIDDSEFIILWTSGVEKIKVVNLFFFTSLILLIFYLLFSILLTPLALNKSRNLLSQDQFNSFLPTIRTQQFSDSFQGFTFIAEKKVKNEIQNIFLHDVGNNLKNLLSEVSDITNTTVVAEKGIVDKRKIFLFNGQIITSEKRNLEKNDIIKFDQLNIDLRNLATNTITHPKIQETSTKELLKCLNLENLNTGICNEQSNKEIPPNLIRRVILPFYLPVVSLICSLLLIRNNKVYYNKISIFLYSFILLVLSELIIKYTGIKIIYSIGYIASPFILIVFLYFLLIFKFSRETK